MLTFAIPTLNRADRLSICVESIAEQIVETGLPAKILISDNCSDDGTAEIIESLKLRYPFITSQHRPVRGDYAASFQSLFRSLDDEFVWMFGDDDKLLPRSLRRVWPLLESNHYDFIHACVDERAANGPAIEDNLFSLCCRYGWLDLTGYMSSNICRALPLKLAAQSQRWDNYGRFAFVQSCVLLENFARSKAVIIDEPMVTIQEKFNDETMNRWLAENIGGRYFLYSTALQMVLRMAELPQHLPTTFFRYHHGFIWDKLLYDAIAEYMNNRKLLYAEMWNMIGGIAGNVADNAIAKAVVMNVDVASFACALHKETPTNQVLDRFYRSLVERQAAATMEYMLTNPNLVEPTILKPLTRAAA